MPFAMTAPVCCPRYPFLPLPSPFQPSPIFPPFFLSFLPRIPPVSLIALPWKTFPPLEPPFHRARLASRMKSRPGCVYDSPVIFNIFHFSFFSPRSRRNNLLYHFYFTLLQKQRGSFDTDNDDDNAEELCVPTLDRRIQMRM